MEIINNIAAFMFTADKAFWREKIESNRYFATVSVLFALLAGIVTDGRAGSVRHSLVTSFLKWDIYPSLLAATGVVFILVVVNVCESIFASKNFLTGLQRSSWVTGVIVLVFFLGYQASGIMDIVLKAMVVLLLLSFVGSVVLAIRELRHGLQ